MFGMPISQSACLYVGATPTASRNRAICWVGDNHVASLGNSFLCCSFLCFLDFMSKNSHCLMGGSDVVNPGLIWWSLGGFGRVLTYS